MGSSSHLQRIEQSALPATHTARQPKLIDFRFAKAQQALSDSTGHECESSNSGVWVGDALLLLLGEGGSEPSVEPTT
jgi:hypothetical protein